jgi:lipopolysaccharide/colanic/teichoic acid biosynthesis glycosyltransferase
MEFSELIGSPTIAAAPSRETLAPCAIATALPNYFRYKRSIDTCLAIIIFGVLSPIILIVCALAFLDVGPPIFFRQQRPGRGGQPFLIYKIRTLRSPIDRRRRANPGDHLPSSIGILLRNTRLDEFPQLFNIVMGHMSLVGPRPLLPEDQPEEALTRLLVRPGITGWAQVNGGTSLTPTEKNRLDEWYVRNASLRLDLRIIALTIRLLLTGKTARCPLLHR